MEVRKVSEVEENGMFGVVDQELTNVPLEELVANSGHFRCSNAAAAVQGGEYFTESNHLAANTGFLFYQSDLVTLIGQIKRCLHP